MAPDTLQGGFTAAAPDSSQFEEDDDREVTAITALEIETTKTKETLARMRDSNIAHPIASAAGRMPTPPPSSLTPDGSWNTRAIYNNHIFDIGMARTLFKDQPLRLDRAIEQIVKRIDVVTKVNITLIEGELTIVSDSSRHRSLEAPGLVVAFSRYTTDFSTVELTATSERTRLLIIVWREDDV